jgi:DNA-binding IclR family transcriptional regulator
MRTPLNATASGKCILAFSPPRLLERYLATCTLEARTEHTIIEEGALRAEVALTRERGYGYGSEELETGVAALSVPIRDHSQHLLGVLNLSWPVFRVSQARVDQFITLLAAAGQDLSRIFGYQLTAPQRSGAGRDE